MGTACRCLCMGRPMVPGRRMGDPDCMTTRPTSDSAGTRKLAGLHILPALLGGAGAVLLAAGRWGGLAWALLITAAWLLAVTAEAGARGERLLDRPRTGLRRPAAGPPGSRVFVAGRTRKRDAARWQNGRGQHR
jgi:hypothetical protein